MTTTKPAADTACSLSPGERFILRTIVSRLDTGTTTTTIDDLADAWIRADRHLDSEAGETSGMVVEFIVEDLEDQGLIDPHSPTLTPTTLGWLVALHLGRR